MRRGCPTGLRRRIAVLLSSWSRSAISLILTPGRWRVAGVAFGFITRKTTGGFGRKTWGLDAWERELDPRIAPYVKVLRKHGVETFESCEGGVGHAIPEPTVRFHGQRPEGFRALAVARTFGLPVHELRRSWPLIDGEPTGPYWELTFYLPSVPRRAQ